MGRLGKIVARYGLAFQMKVAAYDPYLDLTSFPVECEKLSLDDLLATSDYVIVLATYNEGDQPIIGKGEFEKFRFGSVLINVARGELIDEEALLIALDNGTLRGFGADVLCGDSGWSSINRFDSKIVDRSLKDSSIIITPHMGGYAVEAIEKTRQFMIYKVRDYLNQIPVV
jgi:D-3-phosphoglycerate dehydrogenase